MREVRAAPLRPGSVVIAYLQAPRERFCGVLRSLDATGVVVEGIDLDSFEDWLRQASAGGGDLGLSVVFFPLLRLEKILLDEDSGSAPSLSRRFEQRVGRTLRDYVDASR